MPPILYKYCDVRGMDILLNLRLKITPPNRFNDPFEFAPRMKPGVSRREARRLIKSKDAERTMFANMTRLGKFSGSFKQFKQMVRLTRGKLIDGIMAQYPSVAADFRKKAVEIASSTYGVLCLSAVRENILMWSHYGRSHTGLVIGLNTGHAFLNSKEPLLEVEYREERVKMGYVATPRSRELHEQVNSLMKRKSPQWSYEREWRQVRFLQHCKTEEDPNFPGQMHHFIAIEPELIREVIVGCRATETLIRQLKEIKSLAHFAHVEFLQGRMHKTDFALEFGPL